MLKLLFLVFIVYLVFRTTLRLLRAMRTDETAPPRDDRRRSTVPGSSAPRTYDADIEDAKFVDV